MGDAAKASGPDLAAGISANDLVDGKPLVGHVGDESVMLVKQGGEIFATGATCTHYLGPLGEGLVVGDTVRCPWHHACFDLRTGEAVKAPALNPIACWDVVRQGELVKVGDKRAPAAPPKSASDEPKRIVIVGAGAAGHAAAEQLRLRGYRGQLVMIGADAAGPVDRPNLSKDYLAGNAPEEWIPLRGSEWFADNGIELVLGTRVAAIDAAKRTVTCENGRSWEYDRLLLATGAEPIKLPIAGADGPRVHYLRTLDDSRRLIDAAKGGKRAVVVGASFIGLEVAASLRARELEVHVVAPDEVPLQRVMGKELGAYLKSLHEEHGVKFHLGRKPQAIAESGAGGLSVKLDDGSEVACDFVVIGVGVRPAAQLAGKAGLKLDNGVVVDGELRTSDPHIWAAGDLARYPDARSQKPIRVEHWVVAERQGQTAARNMLGARQPFADVPFFWSQHYDVGINYVGHAEHYDRVTVDGDPAAKDCAVRFFAGDELVAVATIFRDGESLDSERRMEENRP